MNSYLIKDLSDEQLLLLTDAGVMHYPWEKGIIIEEIYLDLVLETLHAKGAKTKSKKYEDMWTLKLTFEPKPVAEPVDAIEPGSTEPALPPTAEEIEAARVAEEARLLAEEQKRQAEETRRLEEEARKRDASLQEARRRYIKACESRIKSIVQNAAAASAENTKKLGALKQRYVIAKRAEVFGKQLHEPAQEALVRDELERARLLPNVEAVNVVPGKVFVSTDQLYAFDPTTGVRHVLGKFLITIHLDGSNDGIRWLNSTRRVDAIRSKMNAPNVFANGEAAPSEFLVTLMDLLARLELSTLVELAMQFVESGEANEYAKYISKWPAA